MNCKIISPGLVAYCTLIMVLCSGLFSTSLNGQTTSDCSGAVVLCGDLYQEVNASLNTGDFYEFTGGCNANLEQSSVWYTFTVQAAVRSVIADLTFAQTDALAMQRIRRFQFLRDANGRLHGYAIMQALSLENTLLGVDVIRDHRLLISDAEHQDDSATTQP